MVVVENPEAGVSADSVLDEPTRRRLYDHVVRQAEPVSRDEAAALELLRTTAAFHLEPLAAAGLLDVVYQRRTGRSGPGAGRPTKHYRRSHRQLAVSLPERRYDLAGRLLAAALEDAERSGESPEPPSTDARATWARSSVRQQARHETTPRVGTPSCALRRDLKTCVRFTAATSGVDARRTRHCPQSAAGRSANGDRPQDRARHRTAL
ncbi:helix-turn-helix domain-containing protein [Nocardioides speluncae]|uniref:helix-turn-helix domain-containing protein n=1 Tax=Nocardioides speluncae TaxID=2670337 RepID=UPI001F0BEEB8|nr:helix-turn-helix domain-containing protein [Nocardioides speluncae]